jgi:citrate lyase beta subunit
MVNSTPARPPHAYRVLAAFSNGEGVASLDGKMLDSRI